MLTPCALLALSSGAWAAFDRPDGQPPFGLDFADSTSGEQLHGYLTMVFLDFDAVLLRARSFEAVTVLRKGTKAEGNGSAKGGARHVFRTELRCSETDPQNPSGVCDTLCFDPTTGIDDDGNGLVDDPEDRVLDVTEITSIQLCLQEELSDAVVAAFGSDADAARLKDVSGFVSEPDPAAAPARLIVGADVEVTLR